MIKRTIATEAFSSMGGKRNYFLDFMLTANKRNYIKITRSEKLDDGKFQRSQVIFFQDDFEELITAFASLFHSAAYAHQQEQSVIDLFNQKKAKDEGGIKGWEEHLRPREKFLKVGPSGMKSEELLAMLIGSGSNELNAIELSKKVLEGVGGNLSRLPFLSQSRLAEIKGIGLAKSSAILAALELGRRAFQIKGRFNPPVQGNTLVSKKH